MFSYSLKNTALAIAISVTALQVTAQKVKEPKAWSTEWAKPYQPFRIAGNLYYVGTYDLACYLITTAQGNILINTGLAASEKQIKNNIKALGFKFTDIKILLNTQAHYDHMGAMAAIKKKTGAQLMINEKDAAEVESGGSSDYALGGHGSSFIPAIPSRLLKDADTIKLGNMQLLMLHHPGHTKGSCSFLFTVTDEQQSYKVLIANMPTIVTDSSFTAIPNYPVIAADYAYTLNAMKNISFDIWLASHASQFKMHSKHQPSDGYNPAAFKDQAGYDAALNDLQKKYEEKMRKN
ncbi:MAG: subclass metallo-beta-lactamase [Bacteroidota bacterium]|jgi:metallo-beta-lactamase class B